MVEEILDQEQVRADSGSPLKPTATLSLSQSNIDFPALDAVDDPVPSHSIDVIVDVSEWDSAAFKRSFLAEKGHPIVGTTDDGQAEYDESRTIYTPNSDPSAFDDAADPTKCAFHRTTGSSENSDWHVVIVVWGSNLVPAVAFETVTVVRGN
ncbi:MAG: hypothetical protein K8I27_05665 [Planctomycetes bacterium]|nr:hypothetical protein [Planctomycetota bacterium]